MNGSSDIIYKYWGKARSSEDTTGPLCHLLPYHCLDVAAVADCWLNADESLNRMFVWSCEAEVSIVRAWILFFIALHDLGKFDVRFQLKAPEISLMLSPIFKEADPNDSVGFDHGNAGTSLFDKELMDFGFTKSHAKGLNEWMIAVAGHHGKPAHISTFSMPRADATVIEHDRTARNQWLKHLIDIFLIPSNISLNSSPPKPPNILAGFCSVCDWLGSNDMYFSYVDEAGIRLKDYFESRKKTAHIAFKESGLWRVTCQQGGMSVLFPEFKPKGIQVLVENLPVEQGVTIIEAPTGSGKTEAALAYASQLISRGYSDSIIFALPTQASANAMFSRLEKIAGKIFPGGGNLLLAHGKARFNDLYNKIKEFSFQKMTQGKDDALAECVQWLSASRKRVFLGQIGVCTIDQVLLSVLPIRHNFVRAFGVRKSILIIDEIHAYDSYMYGLLDRVLKEQSAIGGIAVLLSATLPLKRRQQLILSWGIESLNSANILAYPLLSHAGVNKLNEWSLPYSDSVSKVAISLEHSKDLIPSDSLLKQICDSAEKGAKVAFICNTVADAQNMARELKKMNDNVRLFHSRFRFCDRQEIEEEVMNHYGKGSPALQGSILVATQVIEQSLDLDFDWMITQLCPIDLLFQRLGRLHRHDRLRPKEYEKPHCTILAPDGTDYGVHESIYGDAQILWRTHQLLKQNTFITFPHAYRDWIEKVYMEEAWEDEPERIKKAHELFIEKEEAIRYNALFILNADANPLSDTDGNVSTLTRDGEMNLNVVLLIIHDKKKRFLDNVAFNEKEEKEFDEKVNLESIPVPHSWHNTLPDPKDGIYYLNMVSTENAEWTAMVNKTQFIYNKEFGLEKRKI